MALFVWMKGHYATSHLFRVSWQAVSRADAILGQLMTSAVAGQQLHGLVSTGKALDTAHCACCKLRPPCCSENTAGAKTCPETRRRHLQVDKPFVVGASRLWFLPQTVLSKSVTALNVIFSSRLSASFTLQVCRRCY